MTLNVPGDVAGARQEARVMLARRLELGGDRGDVDKLPDLDLGADGQAGAVAAPGPWEPGMSGSACSSGRPRRAPSRACRPDRSSPAARRPTAARARGSCSCGRRAAGPGARGSSCRRGGMRLSSSCCQHLSRNASPVAVKLQVKIAATRSRRGQGDHCRLDEEHAASREFRSVRASCASGTTMPSGRRNWRRNGWSGRMLRSDTASQRSLGNRINITRGSDGWSAL